MGLFSRKEKDSFTIKNGVCTVRFVGKKKLTKKRVDAFFMQNKEIHDCDTVEVIIGKNTNVIEKHAFGHRPFASVTIPSSVIAIGELAFSGHVSCFNVDESNQNFKSVDGDLYTKDGKVLITYAKGKPDKDFNVPDGVTTIDKGAFYGSKLVHIWLPESVTTISDNSFNGCAYLTSLTIPSKVTAIESKAFYFCEKLQTVTIPNSVTSIGREAFWHCDALTSITIPGSVTSIGDCAFGYCKSLKIINILPGVKSIGTRAFEWSGFRMEVTIPSSVISIGAHALTSASVIYCQVGKQPKGWNLQWKGDSRASVKWGWEIDGGKQLND